MTVIMTRANARRMTDEDAIRSALGRKRPRRPKVDDYGPHRSHKSRISIRRFSWEVEG